MASEQTRRPNEQMTVSLGSLTGSLTGQICRQFPQGEVCLMHKVALERSDILSVHVTQSTIPVLRHRDAGFQGWDAGVPGHHRQPSHGRPRLRSPVQQTAGQSVKGALRYGPAGQQKISAEMRGKTEREKIEEKKNDMRKKKGEWNNC